LINKHIKGQIIINNSIIMKSNTLIIFLPLIFALVKADLYLHNPRGSNNRCDERTNDRNNANRLFDSQNNAAGGYAIGCDRPDNAISPDNITCYNMSYYEETVLPITWTSQHNCGEENSCEILIQYMCHDNMRDGLPQNALGNTCTQTIPLKNDSDIDNFLKYGKQETFDNYLNCISRPRNTRLFTADQVLRGTSSQYTRQNPNGDRYGFECPEERDYYPYWAESNWVDIAILTSNLSRCEYYMNNSRCNVNKYECTGVNKFISNQTECELNTGIWKTYQKFNDCNMTCANAPSGTINRLGIGQSDNKFNTFHWKLPKLTTNLNNCILRIRYNITTNETPWSFTRDNNTALKNYPIVNTSKSVPVRLAIDTSQFGRTFQDRSYIFNIINRPTNLQNTVIHNVNVQGKRGNIAQVRNCIEYDYIPNELNITVDDYVHFQWVGSDFNPPNNEGEGRRGTDRTNLVELSYFKNNIPIPNNSLFDIDTSYVLATINQDIFNSTMCYTYQELLRNINIDEDLKNCAILNAAPPYFNMVPLKINKTGTYLLMNSRNNNFSNRAQKMIMTIVNKTTPEPSASTVSGIIRPSYIIAGAIGLLVLVGLIVVIHRNKKSISENIENRYKLISRSFASTV
jgi:hypothetical protein